MRLYTYIAFSLLYSIISVENPLPDGKFTPTLYPQMHAGQEHAFIPKPGADNADFLPFLSFLCTGPIFYQQGYAQMWIIMIPNVLLKS